MRILGGVPVDRDPADSDPTAIGGVPIDVGGVAAAPNVIPTNKTTFANDGASSVPTLPTPSGGSGTAPATTTTTSDTSAPPLIIPPPSPSVPGVDGVPSDIDPSNPYLNTGRFATPDPAPMTADQGIAETSPRGTTLSAPDRALDASTPSSGVGSTLPATAVDVTAPQPVSTVAAPMPTPTSTDPGTQATTTSTPAATTNTTTNGATPNDGGQQQIVLSLLAALMGNTSNNVGFADPGAAGGAANPDAGNVGQFTSAQLTPIDPMNDLRDKMITPSTDDLTEQARQHMADAQNNLSSFDRGTSVADALKAFSPDASLTGVDTAPSDRLKALQAQVDQATTGLSSVDRTALAKQMYDTWKSETDPDYDLQVRQATQRAAATGGLGSGGLRTDYGNLARVRMNDETNKKNELIQQAISDSINDAMNKQARLSSLEGQMSSEEAARRGEVRTDQDRTLAQFNNNRNFADQFAGEKASDLASALTGASSVFGQTANEETNRRQELRGERDYQVGQEKSAFDRQLEEYQTQQQAQKDRFGEGLSLLNLASNGNPSSVLASLGAQGGDLTSLIEKFASQLGKQSATNGGSAGDSSALANLIPLISKSLQGNATARSDAATQGIDTSGLASLLASMTGG